MTDDADIAIIGAGPAGLACAEEALNLGLRVTLVDDNPRPGGQYLRHPGFATSAEDPFGADARASAALLNVVRKPGLTYRPGAVVWDFPAPATLAVADGEASGRIAARAVVLAAGAQDRPVPFPGWTLPGVIGAGAAQNLVKGARIAPGRRAVVAGNGPLVLLVAATLRKAGVEVVAVAEAARIAGRVAACATGLAAWPDLLLRGLGWRLGLAVAGIPYLSGHVVLRADGTDEGVERVLLARLSDAGVPEPDAALGFEADTLVLGYGLVPSIELARVAGCVLEWSAEVSAFLPRRDEAFRTSVPWLFAVGDGAAIGGARVAEAEGRVVAHAIAAQLGHAADLARRAAAVRRLGRAQRFSSALARLYAMPPPPFGPIAQETVICRCEGATWAQITKALGSGHATAVEIKAATRLSMGRCQGRNCLPTLMVLAGRDSGGPPGPELLPAARPPARPVPLRDLLAEPIPPPSVPADPHLPRTVDSGATKG